MAGTKLGIKVGRPDNREFLLYAILNDFWGGIICVFSGNITKHVVAAECARSMQCGHC